MGANEDWVTFGANDKAEAIRKANEAIRERSYERGHGGYTGTLAEVAGIRYIGKAKDESDAFNKAFGEYNPETGEPISEGAAYKRGPGVLIELPNNLWFFGGVCAS